MIVTELRNYKRLSTYFIIMRSNCFGSANSDFKDEKSDSDPSWAGGPATTKPRFDRRINGSNKRELASRTIANSKPWTTDSSTVQPAASPE